MGWRRFAARTILGTSLPNEYICTTPGSLEDPVHAFLDKDGTEIDVTAIHMLLGYKPLAIGFTIQDPGLAAWLNRRDEIRLSFRQQTAPKEIAWLVLKKLGVWRMGEINLLIFSGHKGRHTFMGGFHQTTNRVYEMFRPTNPDNATPGNLYDQIRIAYCISRSISIISLGDGKFFNFFPTDLQGQVGSAFYAGSLRIGGKACQQVESLRKVVISKVSADAFREIYSLAKNHTADMKEQDIFAAAEARTEKWNLPYPRYAVSYKELLWKNSSDVGIHRIHFYEVVGEKVVDQIKPELSHIHRFYAQWRINNRLDSQYFFR